MKQKPVTCRSVFIHLCDNLDKGLNSPRCRQIKQHLDGCADCVAYLESLKSTIELFRRYPLPPRSRKARLHVPTPRNTRR